VREGLKSVRFPPIGELGGKLGRNVLYTLDLTINVRREA